MKFTSFARLFGKERRQKNRRAWPTAGAPRRPWGRFVRPRVESLEDRTVLSVLPAAQVSGQGTLAPAFTTQFPRGNANNTAAAVDPLNPNDVVAVYSDEDPMDFPGARQTSYIGASYSTDGGQTWSPVFWGLTPWQTNLLDPDTPYMTRMPFTDATDPSISFDRNHNFYVVFSEHSGTADQMIGAIVLSKFSFPDQGTPSMVPIDSDPADQSAVYKPLYTWGYQGTDGNTLGYDAAYQPVVMADSNLGSYRDLITGAFQTDPYAGNIYVAFNTNYRPPTGPINPNAIDIMASSDGGLSFTSVKHFNLNGFIGGNLPSERDSAPQLVVSQGTSNLRPASFGTVPGGQLTGVWNEWGINKNTLAPANPGRVVTSNTITDGAFSTYATGSLTGVCTGGRPGTAMNGIYCDALHPAMGNADIPTLTTFPLISPVALPPTDPVTGLPATVTGFNVTLDLEDNHLDDLEAQISHLNPDGTIQATYTLFINHVNPDGTTNMGGFATAGKYLGVSHSPTHTGTVLIWDAVFDNLVPRTMVASNPMGGNNSIYTGHERPESPFPSLLPVATAVNGQWVLQLNNTRDNSMEANHLQKAWKWGISFTQHLTTPSEKPIPTPDTVINLIPGLITNTFPNAVVGGEYQGKVPANQQVPGYPFGISPGITAASDNTLGTFSPYQGRIYVAYTGTANPNKAVPSGTAATGVADTDIYLYYSDDGGTTWFPWKLDSTGTGVQPVNDDLATDGTTQGNRTQFEPHVAVDQYTGTVVMTYRDARFDAANARFVMTLATSTDGGRTFQNQSASQGQQVYLNAPQQAVDAVTGKIQNVAPIPDNESMGNTQRNANFGWGDYTGLAVADGHVYPFWAGNANANFINVATAATAGFLHVYTAQVNIAAGPRVVGSTMGPVTQGTEFQVQDGTTPVPYNATFAADGTQMIDGFVVTFDRPISDGRVDLNRNNHGALTLNPADITIFFNDTVSRQMGTAIPVLSVTPLFDTDPTSPLWSLAAPSASSEPPYNAAMMAAARPQMLLAQQEFGANKFLVRFQPQSRIGTYSFSVGPNPANGNPGPQDMIRSPLGDPNVLGNFMDQNANGTAGEFPTQGPPRASGGDTYADPMPLNNGPNFQAPYNQLTLPLIVPGPHVVTTFVNGSAPSADNLVTSGLANSVDVVFDRDMDPNSFYFQQLVSVTGAPTGGTFTLSLNGQTTAPIRFNASAAEVQAALEGIIGQGNVQVTGPTGTGTTPGGPWTVNFTGADTGIPLGYLTANSSLTGTPGGAFPGVFTSLLTVTRLMGPTGPIFGPFNIVPDPNPNYPRLINGNVTSAPDPDPTHPRTYKITFPPQQLNGSYSLNLAATIRSAQGDQIDVNRNAGVDVLRDVPSGGTRQLTYSNLGTGTRTATTITAPIVVTDNFVIQGITLQLSINTLDVRDLSAVLQAPDGTTIPLFTNVGANGTSFVNFTNTIFSDSATGGPGSPTNPIQNGQAPFTGTYNPQQPLSQLVGKASVGTYNLIITSKTSLQAHSTSLVSWVLNLVRPIPITGLGEPVADQTPVNFRLFSLAASDPVSTKTWTAVGPAGIGTVDPLTGQLYPSTHSSRIAGIAVDPSDPSGNTAYVAGASGGVWKTTNFLTTNPGGPTYVPLTDTAPTFGLNIGNIAVFPRNNDPNQSAIFVVTGEGDTSGQLPGVGFLRSLDGGASWTLLDSTNNLLPYAQRDHKFVGTVAFRVVADPTPNPSGQVILYAALSGVNGGIWRSTDTGNTWSLMRSGQATDVFLAAGSADATNGNLRIVYGAFRGDGVYISTDSGNRWNLMAGGAGVLWYDVVRNQYVSVTAPPSTPNGAKGRITLAGPSLVPSTVPNSHLQNLLYQGWLFALVSTPGGLTDGLYVTKDFGQNWTQIQIKVTPTPAGVVTPVYPTNNETDPNLSILGSPGFAQGNYNQSLAVDPNNPNLIYVGGTADNNTVANPTTLIRVDITAIADARTLLAHNNFRADGGVLEPNTIGPTVLTGGGTAQEGPWGILDPQQFALGFTQLYTPQNVGYLNLLNDPYNPFLFNSTILVADLSGTNPGILNQSNTGIQVKWVYYDTAVSSGLGTFGSTDQHRVLTMLDPLTGKTRLIFGDDQGIFSVVDPGDGTTNFITGIGTAAEHADPSRSGNLQLNQFYGGASQPSQLAANIAGALLYGEAQDNGFPLSDPNLLKNGNIQWTGPSGDGQWVGTDQTGSGSVYESRWPCCQGGEGAVAVNTDFFRFNRNTSRTFGLFLNPPPDRTNWPDAPSFNAAVNPINGNQLVISSAIGNVFRTDSGGFQWFLIGNGMTDLDGSNAQALAYGAPDPRDPTGATDNFIWAGTVKGNIYVTIDGGGTWVKTAGLDGSSVQFIVADPARGTHIAYAVTFTGVFEINFDNLVALNPATNRLAIAGTPTWVNITGNLFQYVQTALGDPAFAQSARQFLFLTSLAADWRYAILDNPSNPTGPTHPVLYIGGNGGVFRSLDNGKTWTIFPAMTQDGAPVDGGYLPHVQVTHLDLVLGDVNPQTGLTLPATSPDLLLATTYGRGQFAIRVAAPPAVEEVFAVGLDSRVYGQHLDSRGIAGGPYFRTSIDLVQSIATGHDAAGRPVVFALGLDNQVYYQRFDLNGNPVGDFVLAAVGAIKTYTVTTDPSGNPELFVTGLNDNVFGLTFDANDSPVGGYFLAGLGAVKTLALSHDTQGRPELFVIGLDNQIYARRFDANGQPLPTENYFLTQAGQVKALAVGQNSTNQPVVYAIGLDSQVYGQRFDDNGLSASGWFLALASTENGPRLVKTLQVGHDANNNPLLFVTGLNDNIFLAALAATGSPLAPDYSLAALGAVKDFKIGYDANNIPEIFALGLDDQIYYELFNPPGNPSQIYQLMDPGRVKGFTVTK